MFPGRGHGAAEQQVTRLRDYRKRDRRGPDSRVARSTC